jgi:DNA repair exonuclease SbcCD ATPase subunit
MHVAALRLNNWACFRGAHAVALEPIPYAVTATQDGNPERSNWGGKSTLLEAVLFALYGVHRHRFEEGWISHGEKSGEVALALSTGVVVRRWRESAGGTKLEVKEPPHAAYGGDPQKDVKQYAGDVAQRRIDEMVGLGLEDFRTTSFFAQGEIAAMVRADPATRTATVARWLRLEPLERCAKSVRGRAEAAERELERVRGRVDAAKQRLDRALTDVHEGITDLDTPSETLVTEEQLRNRIVHQEEALARWDALLAAANERAANERLRAERARVHDEGARLLKVHREEDGAALEKELEVVRGAEDAARTTWEEAKAKKETRRIVATGTFAGVCPVAGIACPATEQINNLGAAARQEATRAAQALDVAAGVLSSVRESVRLANERVVARKSRAERLRTLQEQYRAMAPQASAAADPGMPHAEVQEGRDRAARELENVRRRVRDAEEARAELRKLDGEVEKHQETLAVCREASAIFGRSGAQRRLAEGVLGAIGRRANGMLGAVGAELSLEVLWERDGKGLADECDACGAAFPSSAKVKRCAACGAERGPKRIQRLDVELSNRSGAAEDLAGLALSLSAGQFLRADRGSPWSLVCFDEPTAQMDRAHRRAFAAHVPALLAAAQVEQALVISHDPQSVASLPGQIVVTSDGRWSRVEVRT